MMIREVVGNKAHIAPHGQKTEAFRAFDNASNCSTKFLSVGDAKIIRECYDRLQKRFDGEDSRDAMTSVVGVEVTEQQELLSVMREAQKEPKHFKTSLRRPAK